MRIAFFVSGHGYGHAIRMAEVMKALLARRPEARLFARSTAPARLFPPGVEFETGGFDAGVAETPDTLRILPDQTAERLRLLMDRADEIVAREPAWLAARRIELLVADIPFLAGDIAARAGVPCIGIGNFTWDWIYEPHLSGHPRWAEWDARMRSAYARFAMLLKLPFAQTVRLGSFREVREVPLIARRGKPTAGPPRVLVAMRGAVEENALRHAAREAPEFVFVHLKPETQVRERNVILGSGPFEDLLASSRIVVSKPGYGTIADCVTNRKHLLYPPREGFAEDPISLAEASRYIRLAPIPPADFHSGNWASYLRHLNALEAPHEEMRCDGASHCAETLLSV